MAETLLQKAQRLGIKPAGTPVASTTPSTTSPQGETLAQKAQRLGVKPAGIPVAPPQEKSLGFFGRIQKGVDESAERRAQSLRETSDLTTSGKQSFVRGAFQTGGQLVGSAIDPVLETAKQATPEVVKKGLGKILSPLTEGISYAADKISDIPAVQKFAQTDQSKSLEKDIEAGNEYLNLLPAPKATKALTNVTTKAVDKATDVLPDVINKTKNVVSDLVSKSEGQIESSIMKRYEKGVKPLLPGKTTPTKLAEYKDDVITAVKTINENKANFKFSDEFGDLLEGKNPSNLKELSEAIDQTKKAVFKKYDDLAKKAGEAGVVVKAEPIAKELDTVINNEALSFTSPETIKYAQDMQKRLQILDEKGNIVGYKSFGSETAQEIIQNYNKSLEAFYRNPSYDTASRAAIDAMVVNRMRQSLDEGISTVTGTKYQELKNQYGSLKAIEKDVIKATLRDSRKNVKGLLDYTDIFSGGQIVSGLLTLNPAMFAKGVAERSIKEWFQFLNNPNRAVRKMFETVEGQPKSLNMKIPQNTNINTPAPIKYNNALPNNTPNVQTKPLSTNGPIESGEKVLPKIAKNEINPTSIKSDTQTAMPKTITPVKKKSTKVIPTNKIGSNSSLNDINKSLITEAKKYKSAEEFVKAIKENPEKIPTTPEYQKFLKEQESFIEREKAIYAEMKAMRETYSNKTINDVPAEDITKYDNLQKELSKSLSQKTLAKSPEGVIKTHIGEKGLTSQLEEIWNTANSKKVISTNKIGASDPFDDFPRDKSLKGSDAEIQEKSIKKYTENKETLLKEYMNTNGNVVNTDEARKLFKDVGYKGSNARAVQEASSALAKDAWRSLLKSSKADDVFIYAGGSGTGKTSVVKKLIGEEISKAGAILDGNLSTLKSAVGRIEEAVKAGKTPKIVYVYRDAKDAWINGVIKRMKNNPEEGGRIVPLSVFLDNHAGSHNVIRELLKTGKYDVKLLDNSMGKGNEALLSKEKFDSINYDSSLRQELLDETKKLYEQGNINKTEYEELIQ